jgi:hypothetical protein
MLRLIKVVVVLAVVGLAGLTGYAYLGLSAPVAQETRVPVTLNVD